MKAYAVRPLREGSSLSVSVPASKSIFNRAIELAALSGEEVFLRSGVPTGDSRVFLDALKTLGIQIFEEEGGFRVFGKKRFPVEKAEINVGRAGTVARFLPVALARLGGEYTIDADDQMKARPMDELILSLRELGAEIRCLERENALPFVLKCKGFTKDTVTVDTDISSQYASAFLLAAGAGERFTLRLTGNPAHRAYVQTTLSVMKDFNIPFSLAEGEITVFPAQTPPKIYEVEADLSGAAYFYSLALLLRCQVLVKQAKRSSSQTDDKFLNLLEERGVRFAQTPEGLLADGSGVRSFGGFDVDMQDFSDQTATVAVLAAFASSPTSIRNVAHIRRQECDRLSVIVENLTALGVPAQTDGENLFVSPVPREQIRSATVDPHGDHRMAMAFSLVGLATGRVKIADPDCTAKTFEGYFDVLTELTK